MESNQRLGDKHTTLTPKLNYGRHN